MALKPYDMICIFPTSLNEEALGDVLTRMDDEIVRLGGQAVSKQPMGERVFARPMKKHDAGVYMTVRCELEPTSVDALLARLKLVDNLIRVQVLVAEPAADTAEEAVEAPAEEVVVNG
jgi:ribosomal protein S6